MCVYYSSNIISLQLFSVSLSKIIIIVFLSQATGEAAGEDAESDSDSDDDDDDVRVTIGDIKTGAPQYT